jgi:N-methylhydantoinase B/oxoprolinase/acetone carboxylase alpha subunit
VRSYAVRRGSGGRGSRRGGDGIIREIETLVPARASLLADRRARAPYGLAGGGEGRPGRDSVLRQGGRVERVGSKGSWDLAAGDRVRIETPGGGGHGRAPKRGAKK